MARASKSRCRRTKEGPPVLQTGGPGIGQRPDWEESVPNPARKPFTTQWLNGALMGRIAGLAAAAVADAMRLQHVAERQIVRDALGLDAAASAA